MKKQLLSTSAIALGVAFAAPASAQEWDMDWGGFAFNHIAIVDVKSNGNPANAPTGSDFDGVNTFTSAEFIFRPSVTLDNGMTFGYEYQIEGINTNNVDESYLSISSDTLGKILVGSENSAGYLLMGSVYTPTVGTMAIASRSTFGFIPLTGSGGWVQAQTSPLTEVAGNNDVARITYFTPSFNGLTVGVSYAPSGERNARNNLALDFNADSLTDIFDIGVAYSQSFNGVDVGLAARWGTGNTNVVGVSDPTTWGIGGTVGYSGFTFGATYAENNNGGPNGNNGANPASVSLMTPHTGGDQAGWTIGATYDLEGPWAIGVSTVQGEMTNNPGQPKSDYEAYHVGAERKLGSGVSWEVYYVYTETNNGAVAGNPTIEASMVGTGINLRF